MFKNSITHRVNPLVLRKDGYIVPNVYSDLWFHGSGLVGSEPLQKFQSVTDSPYAEYDATFFSSSRISAADHAGYEDEGYLYAATIKDVPLFDVDDIFENRSDPMTGLTKEGVKFRNALQENFMLLGNKDAANQALMSLRTGDWENFDSDHNSYYSEFFFTLEEMGYRGWVEFEGGALSIALLFPHEDAEIMWVIEGTI